jgi:hypothetical protein
MALEDTFNGATNAFSLAFAYINTVAQEIGMEQALALDAKTWEAMGAAQGKTMKEEAGIEGIDAQTAIALTGKLIEEGLGITSEVAEASPQRAMTKVGKCPLYEAGQMLGMDPEAIEALCRAGAIRYMDAVVKQLNPSLSYQLSKFRTAADDFCEEVIVLG